MSLSILYRGDLSSCNYGCDYCPFAKRKDTREQLAKDKADLQRFVQWVSEQNRESAILFTPWGEALIRGYYREAIVELSLLANVKKVAIQTNFSCGTEWLSQCARDTVAFWVTYHPDEITLEDFVAKCHQLDQQQVAYSVGVVGLKDHFDAIQKLRDYLDDSIYMWINAYKRESAYYNSDDQHFLTSIDPLFEMNNQHHPSLNKICHTGERVISVNGDGDVTRCHFIKKVIGNIYDENFESCLKPSKCSNDSCSCYIGYIHMPDLGLDRVYGDGILERIYSI